MQYAVVASVLRAAHDASFVIGTVSSQILSTVLKGISIKAVIYSSSAEAPRYSITVSIFQNLFFTNRIIGAIIVVS